MKKIYKFFFSLLSILFFSHFVIHIPIALAGNCNCSGHSWGACYEYQGNYYQYRACDYSDKGSDTCSEDKGTCGAGNYCQVRQCTPPTSTPGPNPPPGGGGGGGGGGTGSCAPGCYGAASGHNGTWKCQTYAGSGAYCIKAYGDMPGGGNYSCAEGFEIRGCNEPFYSVLCGCPAAPTATPRPPTATPIPTNTPTPNLSATPTSTPSATPTASPTPTPTINPNCKCKTDKVCAAQCDFDYYPASSGISYTKPLKCGLTDDLFTATPSATDRNHWCLSLRAKGDSDGSGTVNTVDYLYYISGVVGRKLPPSVNPDFDGDNLVSNADRNIIIKTLTSQ